MVCSMHYLFYIVLFEGEAPCGLIRVVPTDLKSQSSPLLGTAPSAEIRA